MGGNEVKEAERRGQTREKGKGETLRGFRRALYRDQREIRRGLMQKNEREEA